MTIWSAPKTNWTTFDAIGYGALNRIEQNIEANRDANFRRVQGFGYTIDNSVSGQDGVITVLPGSCYSENGVPIRMNSSHVKNISNSWASGNGATYGSRVGTATAARTWYYIYVIADPTTGNTEIMIDDSPTGANVTSGVYTEKRYIGSVQTLLAGGDGGYDFYEMYSTGDRVFINNTDVIWTLYPNSGGINNTYNLITLTSGAYPLLPARGVLAQLNIKSDNVDVGLTSSYSNVFTPATSLFSAGSLIGEVVFYRIGSTIYGTMDTAIMVDANRQLYLAMYQPAAGGNVEINVRGFYDDRLI